MTDLLDSFFPGALEPGMLAHFMHKGKWAIHQVLPVLLSRIGPADVSVATFNISEDSLRTLFFLNEDRSLLSLRLLLDMNVRRHKFTFASVRRRHHDFHPSGQLSCEGPSGQEQ